MKLIAKAQLNNLNLFVLNKL